MGNPKILNLDELDLKDTGIEIVHDGETHRMRLLTVEMFIKQQKRQRDHEKRVDAEAEGAELVDAVELIRDSVAEFFPTIPVNDLPTPKLFRIFAFLNEITAQMNADASEDVVAETEEELGNEPAADQTES